MQSGNSNAQACLLRLFASTTFILTGFIAGALLSGAAYAGSVLPRTGWAVTYVDSQETVGANEIGANAIDGNPSTVWRTAWWPAPTPPHEIRIDMGRSYELDGFRYLPHPNSAEVNGRIAQYEFYVSADGTNWGTAVATGTFANSATEKQVNFALKSGRYIRLRALSEVNGNPWAMVAELNVLGNAPTLSRTGWSVRYVDSQETANANEAGANVLDGNALTVWRTAWWPAPTPPHEIQIDMGKSFALNGFRYVPKADSSDVNGRIARYEFYVSADATNWGTAVATGTFANDTAAKDVFFASKTGRYIRLRALSEVNGNPWTMVAELLAFGETTISDSQNPTVPAELTATAVSMTQVNLSWKASSDDIGVTGYTIYRNGAQIAQSSATSYSDTTLVTGTTYSYAVAAYDASGKSSGLSAAVSVRTLTDTSAPSVPAGLAGVALSPTQVSLSWSASSDNVGVAGYEVYRDGAKLATVLATSYTDSGVLGASTHSYKVAAFDAAGNTSAQSAAVSVMTPAPALSREGWTVKHVDSQETAGANEAGANAIDGKPLTIWRTAWWPAPVPPHEIQIDMGKVYVLNGFRYLPHATEANGRIAQYEFYVSMDGTNWGTAVAKGTFANNVSEKEVTFPSAPGRYMRLLALTEVNGNPWTHVAELNALGVEDSQAPTAPANLAGTPSSNSMNLSWSASADNVAVAGYNIFRNGAKVATVTGTSYADTGLSLSTSYSYAVSAFDGSGNASPQSSSISVKTLGDTTAPSVPSGVTGSGSSKTEINLSWTASTDNVGVAGYEVYRQGSKVGIVTSTSYHDSGLAEDTAYSYQVAAYDSAGNVSAKSAAVSISTLGSVVSRTAWKLKYVDSEETLGAREVGANAFDGNPQTIWRTSWSTTAAPPHEIQIDMGAFYSLSGFRYLSHPTEVNGRIADYEFYVSIDGTNWGVPVSSGKFANDATEKSVTFAKAKIGRYIRLRALSEVNGGAWTMVGELNVVGTAAAGPATVDRSGWKLKYVDSQETAGANEVGANAFDGKPTTIWRTGWSGPNPPHEIQIDMGQYHELYSFRYLPNGNTAEVNGRIAQYEFYVSFDGNTWGAPVAAGTFANDGTEKTVALSGKSGRYIRLRALSEVNGGAWTMVGELNVAGYPGTPPGAAASIVFETQPPNNAGVASVFEPQPAIGFRDAVGNPTFGTAAVTLAAYTDAACTTRATGTLTATANPVTPVNNVAAFAGLKYSKAEKIYLGASASGLPKICSAVIEIGDNALPAITGRLYYVATNGSNSNDGSEARPWAALSYACGRVRTAGDGIVLKAGTYTDNSGCDLAPRVSIRGEGRTVTTVRSSYGGWYITANSNPPVEGYQSVTGFKLDGNGRALCHGMQVSGRHRFFIQDMDFVNIADAAIQMQGLDWWNGADQEWPAVPPPQWGIGDVVRNVTITNSSAPHNGQALNASFLIKAVQDMVIDNVSVVENGTGGNALKSWPGYVKHLVIKNSKFRVTRQNNIEPIPIEIWNFMQDCDVYNNEFYGGYLSLVAGAKDGGAWALKFHDNYVEFTDSNGWGEGHELSLSDADYYRNHFVGYTAAVWVAGHMYNHAGVNHVQFRNNVVERAHKAGMVVWPGNPLGTAINDLLIANNVITDSAGTGISIDASRQVLSNLRIQNNIIQNSGDGGIFLGGGGNLRAPVVQNNAFFNSGGISNGGSGTVMSGNLNGVDPRFRKTGGWMEYFSLQSGSPMINAGVATGIAVPDGKPDIGAFEYTP
ncbi:MAG TPA: discoidin domain-containing protein [Bdellovibrionota bacterium]|nr:discoidin domain-containing protein [Bdellovibrionota bacterium]